MSGSEPRPSVGGGGFSLASFREWVGAAVSEAPSIFLAAAWAIVLYAYWSVTFFVAPRGYARAAASRGEGQRLNVPAACLVFTAVLLAAAAGTVCVGDIPAILSGQALPKPILSYLSRSCIALAVWSLVAHAVLAGWSKVADRDSWSATAVPVLGGVNAMLQTGALSAVTRQASPLWVQDASPLIAMFGFAWSVVAMFVGLRDGYRGVKWRFVGAVVSFTAVAVVPFAAAPVVEIGPSLQPSATVLRDGHAQARAAAALDIAAMGRNDSDAVAALVGAMQDENETVRFCAAYSLARVVDRDSVGEAVTALGSRLADSTEAPIVRCESARALGLIGISPAAEAPPEDVFAPLCKTCGDDDADVRLASLVAASQLDDPEGLQLMVHALTDSSWRVRMAATEGLRLSGSASTPDSLLMILHDTSMPEELHAAVVCALARIGDDVADQALCETLRRDREPGVRRAAAEALGRVPGETGLCALEEALKTDRSEEVRVAAVRALASYRRIDRGAAGDALLFAIHRSEETEAVRQAASESLRNLDRKRARRELQRE